jgi:predicted restriction endonuclease
VPQLLVASHIVPWSKDKENRLNVRNGLCLNALHDRAFDVGLIWISDEGKIQVSPKVLNGSLGKLSEGQWMASFNERPLVLPKGFEPDWNLLKKHRDFAVSSMT